VIDRLTTALAQGASAALGEKLNPPVTK